MSKSISLDNLKRYNDKILEKLNTHVHTSSQLPSYVIEATLATFPSTGETGKIYVDTTTNKIYRWGGTSYTVISDTISLGETASTAYRGDRGKIAYEHSQTTHAPSNAQRNSDITKSEIETKLTGNITTHTHNYDNYEKWTVKVNSETTGEDVTTGEVLTIKGSGSTTVSRTGSEITISSTDTNTVYTHPTTDGNKHVPATGTTNAGKVLTAGSTAGSLSWTALPTALPANGGNADTLDNMHADDFALASHGTHVTYSSTTPSSNGTASAGTASTVSRGDHVHPLQTTITGNSGSATKLQTARSINGTSFNGTADITTANWGRTTAITIGNTTKNVNGSVDTAWTVKEIGALPFVYKESPTNITDGSIDIPVTFTKNVGVEGVFSILNPKDQTATDVIAQLNSLLDWKNEIIEWISTNVDIGVVDLTLGSGWTNPWVDNFTCRLSKTGAIVTLNFCAQGGVLDANNILATVPSNFTPKKYIYVYSNEIECIKITPDGFIKTHNITTAGPHQFSISYSVL